MLKLKVIHLLLINILTRLQFPSFPVYFNYIELVNDGSVKSVTQTVYIRLERSISAGVTLDAKAWTINAVKNKDNFTAP